MTILDVRRADDRLHTEIDWLDSRHSFSFGHHYDPHNTHHGVLLVNNDDVVTAGQGFDTHPHSNMEIVTWVVRGSLVHQDSMGHSGVIYPGLAQRMSAGTGILHSERNDSWRLGTATHTEPVRFIQMWVIPDEADVDPGYQQLEIDAPLNNGDLIPVATGMPTYDSAIRIRNTNAAMLVARMQPGRAVVLPDAPYLHVFVVAGEVSMEGVGLLSEGDAVRVSGGGGQALLSEQGAEVIVWEMHQRLGG